MKRTRQIVAKATVQSKARQEAYKAQHDRKVRTKPKLRVGDRVFLDKPPSTAPGRDDDGNLLPTSKLSRKTDAEDYKVIEVTEQTVKILRDGLEDVVSLDRVTKAPPPLDPSTLKPRQPPEENQDQSAQTKRITANPKPQSQKAPENTRVNKTKQSEPTKDPVDTTPTARLQPPAIPDTAASPTSNETDPAAATQDSQVETQEYVIDKIVDFKDTPDGPRYRVRWYGSKTSEDTWEPPSHIPRNFIRRFHASKKNKSKQSPRLRQDKKGRERK